MNRLIVVLLLGVVAALPGQSAAQGSAGWIVSDQCETSDRPQEVFLGTCLDGKAIVALYDPALSPDGTRIAFSGLFVLNLSDWSLTNVQDGGRSPAWSPDGTKLAFASDELYAMNADGSNVVQLTASVGFRGEPAWSRDGRTIAFDCVVEAGNLDICAINVDGTDFRRLTLDPAWDSGADYSPDGSSIAFATQRFGQGEQIALMNVDGSAVSPLGAGIYGTQPKWSPDGTALVYVFHWSEICDWNGYCSFINALAITSRDGAGGQWAGLGDHPSWARSSPHPISWFTLQACNGLDCPFDGSGSWSGSSPIMSYSWDFGDGTQSSSVTGTHTYPAPGTYRVTLTVTDGSGATGRLSRDLSLNGNVWPIASFTYVCIGGQCTFDASGSTDDGTIVDYFWSFDPSNSGVWITSASGRTVTRRFIFSGSPTLILVTLLVRDNHGAWGRQQKVVDLSVFPNAPPVVALTLSCAALTCMFDASGSSDPDGIINSYTWFFGDGSVSYGGSMASHTYAAAGSYEIRLIVKDNLGVATEATRTVTVVPPAMHIGDLDGTRTIQQNTWTALVTIRVHDMAHGPVGNATVSGSWSFGGTSSCTTDSTGRCLVSKSAIPNGTKVTFTIVNVTKPVSVYSSVDNHDPDADSNGTSIMVKRQ